MPYKLKEGEKFEDDAISHSPHYCPNCGQGLINSMNASFWRDSGRASTTEEPFKGVGYDCYCETCHWVGDIFPCEDSQIVEKRMEFVPYEKVFLKKKKKAKKIG